MKFNLKGKASALAGLAVAAVVPMAASAAVDTTAIIAVITDAGTAAAAIGVAVLSMHYGIKLYKWIKGAG
jgi:hypothetical protein